MTWQFLGGGMLSRAVDRLTLGPVSAPLDRGVLLVKIGATQPGGIPPLSFGVVEPVGATEADGLTSGKHYPQPQPSLVALGPGIGSRFTGTLVYKLRAYNLRWLKYTDDRAWVSLVAWVWNPGAAGSVGNWLSRFVSGGGLRLRPSGQRYGPLGASPLIRHD